MEKKLRVLQVINNVGFGGGENYILTLARNMPPREFEIICTCRSGGAFERALKENGIECMPIVITRKRVFRAALSIVRICRQRKIDVVHAHGPIGALAARLASIVPGGIRPVTTYHIAITKITDIPFWIKKIIACFDRLCSVADKKIIAVSESVRKALICEAAFPEKRISLIYPGIDVSRFGSPRKGTIRRQLGLDRGITIIGVVARLSEEKGINYLLEAMPHILINYPESVLLVAGDGPIRHELENQVTDLGLAQRVTFLGHRRDVPELLADIDVLVMPSLAESFGLVILEGMAAGIPVVATGVGGIPEIITDGREGILVPSGDPCTLAAAVIRVLEDDELRQGMCRRAKEKVSANFTLEKMLSNIEYVYRQVAITR